MKWALTCGAILMLALFLSAGADAGVGTRTITKDQFHPFTVQVDNSGSLAYIVEVTDGPQIDVLLLDGENYARFISGMSFGYLMEGSTLDATHAEAKVQLSEGAYYLIVDHTYAGDAAPVPNVTDTPVTFTFNVQYSEKPRVTEVELFDATICVGGIGVLLTVFGAGLFLTFWNKRVQTKVFNPRMQKFQGGNRPLTPHWRNGNFTGRDSRPPLTQRKF